MRTLHLTHTYPLPPRALLEAMLHPALDAFLAGRLPDLRERKTLVLDRQGDRVRRVVRCVPVARIPEAAQKVVKPEMITWVEDARVDLARGVAEVGITPAGFQDVFHFEGGIRVTPAGEGSVRHMHGQLEIRMFLVGRLVEDYLANLIQQNMAAEGEALAEFIRQGRHLEGALA